nr:MAG TPA: hypothetical protein [Caudoviricetes sp.]
MAPAGIEPRALVYRGHKNGAPGIALGAPLLCLKKGLVQFLARIFAQLCAQKEKGQSVLTL